MNEENQSATQVDNIVTINVIEDRILGLEARIEELESQVKENKNATQVDNDISPNVTEKSMFDQTAKILYGVAKTHHISRPEIVDHYLKILNSKAIQNLDASESDKQRHVIRIVVAEIMSNEEQIHSIGYLITQNSRTILVRKLFYEEPEDERDEAMVSCQLDDSEKIIGIIPE